MNDKEFILEALNRLIPDTSWWGESNHDSDSVKNLDLLSNMIDMMIEALMEYSYVPEGFRNDSYEEIARKKREIINGLKTWVDEYFEDFGDK